MSHLTTNHWDELSRSLAEQPVPRRESLRLLGAALAGAVLSPLGAGTAWGRGANPCKAFCNRYPKAQRSYCLDVCQTCNGDTRRLCGSGWALSCCAPRTTCCNGYCSDPASDFDNCGACGAPCDLPGPYEDGACVDGKCSYWCAEGAADCNGTCTDLLFDPNNCGACGNVCGGATPNCGSGVCDHCPPGYADCRGDGVCHNLSFDSNHCGACGVPCDLVAETCVGGHCVPTEPPPPGDWW